MLHTILNTLKNHIEDYLNSISRSQEGHVMIGGVPLSNENIPNKLIISILNLERETTMGISHYYTNDRSKDLLAKKNPPWHFNMDIILSAIYDNKLYELSLQKLSEAISCLQQYPKLRLSSGEYFTIETVTVTFQELTNVWSMFGGKYYPSIIIKIRMLTFDGEEINATSRGITKQDITTNEN
jgi:Pvc16 N-terminal domain